MLRDCRVGDYRIRDCRGRDFHVHNSRATTVHSQLRREPGNPFLNYLSSNATEMTNVEPLFAVPYDRL